MKRVKIFSAILLLFAMSYTSSVQAQTIHDEVSMMVAVPNEAGGLSADAAAFVADKLKQVCAQNGISNDFYSRFCLTAKLTVVDKNVLGGGQPTVTQTMNLILHIIDNYDRKIFASTTLAISGVGANETKAEINAVKRVGNSPKLQSFIKEGKAKVIAYYSSQVDQIIAQATNLANTKQYEAALYLLSSIPQAVGPEKYAKANNAGVKIFGEYLNHDGLLNLRAAKAIWGANQNAQAANEACALIALIYPESSAYKEGQVLFNQICAKVKDDIAFERKKYQDIIDLRKAEIGAWKEVGVAYGKGQQPITIREANNHH